jgi:hypothetical protein
MHVSPLLFVKKKKIIKEQLSFSAEMQMLGPS